VKTRTLLQSLSFLVASAISLAADPTPTMGTWKLNEAKSKFAAGATKFMLAVYEPAPDGMFKVTLHGADKDGNPVHDEWVGRMDGKDYPVKGDAFADARSYTKIGPRAMDVKFKKSGQLVGTGRIVDSPDGKTRTTITKAAGTAPSSFDNVAVYDRQ